MTDRHWSCPFHEVPQNDAYQANKNYVHEGDTSSTFARMMPQQLLHTLHTNSFLKWAPLILPLMLTAINFLSQKLDRNSVLFSFFTFWIGRGGASIMIIIRKIQTGSWLSFFITFHS